MSFTQKMQKETASTVDTGDLSVLIKRTLALLDILGKDFSSHRQKIAGLQERLANERFHLAVLGQFKRGKSTLLNALLGAELLPSSVVPLTSIPTFISWGSEIKALVRYLDSRPCEEFSVGSAEEARFFIAQYVTEDNNPNNRKNVSQVEVSYPSDLLQKGVVLIDTPGIGSTLKHNTEATLNFLPQCDAALFLISADPPVTEVELDFLKLLRGKVARLFFILNKVDYLAEEERNALLAFFRKVLREQAGFSENTPIFTVSARQGLEARKTKNDLLWAASGVEEVERYLLDFLARGKTEALRKALSKKLDDAIADILMGLNLQHRTLQMPLVELDERLKVFEEKLEEARQQGILMNDLLSGEQKRLAEMLEEQAEKLRQKARAYLGGIVRRSLNSMGNTFNESAVKDAVANAIPGLFKRELEEMSREFGERVREALLPYQRKADEIIEAVRRKATELFEVPYHALNSSEAFEISHKPYWVTYRQPDTAIPLQGHLMAKLLPVRFVRGRLEKELLEQIDTLVMHNVENLRWATLQNLNDAFKRFASALQERLKITVEATHGAIQAARARRLSQAESIVPEIDRLQSAASDLEEIQSKIRALE